MASSDKHVIFCGFAFLSTFLRQWPPRWPPRWTLLTADGCTDRTVPADRADWTVDQLHRYNEFLEREGTRCIALARELERARTVAPHRPRKPVDGWVHPRRNPGRPKGSRYDDDALAALQIQAFARAGGNTMTDLEALIKVRTARGEHTPRLSSPGIRSTINRMVKLRKQMDHKNSSD